MTLLPDLKKFPLFRLNLSSCLLAITLLWQTVPVTALTISPELRAKLEANGAWNEFSHKFAAWHEQLANQPAAINLQNVLAKSTATGAQKTIRVCVLLVDFSDNPASGGAQANITASTVDQILFSQGATQFGSMTDFYLESSYGQFLVDGDVFGWFRMPKTYAQYTGSGSGMQAAEPNARTLTKDAVFAADPTVNFAPYDNDGDLFVDAVFVVHAGQGAEETGSPNQIWSHRWSTAGQVSTGDGKAVFNYIAVPEEVLGGALRVGVYAHEFGHILGLPDLYDVSESSSAPGLGNWSLMAGGSWNNAQRTPAHFDGWCKHVLDSLHGSFGKTIEVTNNLTNVVLGGAVSDSIRYRIKVPGGNGKEYFIIENRQRVGFDSFIPGSGLMILHCDDNLPGSNNQTSFGHWRISLEQADGAFNLESADNSGDGGDLFPGQEGIYAEWTDLTTPSTASWYATPHQISVWDIRHDLVDKTITCNLDLTYSRTNMQLMNSDFSDVTSGNGDQILDKGETIQFSYSFRNVWKSATGVKVALRSSTPGITMLNGTQIIGNVNSGQTINSTTPLTFSISPDISPTNGDFALDIITTNPPDTFTTNYRKYVGGVEILVVDADDSPALEDRSALIKAALDSLSLPYAYWDIGSQNTPGTAELDYRYIIWYTGNARTNLSQAINASEVAFLRSYLDQGGHLYINGQDIAERLAQTADSTFARDYLGVRYLSDYEPLDVLGIAGNPVSDNLRLRIRGGGAAANQYDCDVLEISPEANRLFDFAVGSTLFGAAGSIYARPNGSRVVFTSFGLEAVASTLTTQGYATRSAYLSRVLSFLEDNVSTDADDYVDVRPIPFDFQLRQNYPNPFNPTTQISFTISPRSAGKSLTLDVFNVLGQHVARLREETAQAGTQILEFDASALSSGVYFYRLQVGTESQNRKMVLSK